MKVKKVYYDEQNAQIDALRKKAEFARARATIKTLQETGAPMYWDLLYEGLSTGNLCDEYAKRFAKETFDDWSDQNTRNNLRKKFDVLGDPFHKYRFPQKFVTVAEDGSFDLNEEAVDDYFKEKHTYHFTDEQVKAIENLCKALDELDISPHIVKAYFYVEEGKTAPNLKELGKLFK